MTEEKCPYKDCEFFEGSDLSYNPCVSCCHFIVSGFIEAMKGEDDE